MKCKYCGFENQISEKYCFSCGRVFEPDLPLPTPADQSQTILDSQRNPKTGFSISNIRSFLDNENEIKSSEPSPKKPAPMDDVRLIPNTDTDLTRAENPAKCRFCGFENNDREIFCFICGRTLDNVRNQNQPGNVPGNDPALSSRPAEELFVNRNDEISYRMNYLVGNQVGERLENQQGEVLAEAGQLITLGLIEKVEREGQLSKLVSIMRFPDR